MDDSAEDAFRAFVTARSPALLRSAYLLVGDRSKAEDLLQVTLLKAYQRWRRIKDPAAAEGYVRRAMVNTATSWWRSRPYRERPVDALPERSGSDEIAARIEQEAMWQHLRGLPAKQRAVLVLRYYEGMSEAEIADALNISRGTVKSHTSRALGSLRRQSRSCCWPAPRSCSARRHRTGRTRPLPDPPLPWCPRAARSSGSRCRPAARRRWSWRWRRPDGTSSAGRRTPAARRTSTC
ncbi:SigE family RNA polymerase sigma factor [Dactylosporangium sp. NPDC006015]|uniref:SigE family RNA polymerase sigma factor n=1 Tax=Dactylosporangium sp. NPDC006015 TaxID=3154576 RepID=UPI0033BA0734